MKKLVLGSILTIVLGASVEYTAAMALKSKTWTFGAKDTTSKSRNATDFGTAYKGEFSRVASALAQLVQILDDASDNTALPKQVATAASKAASELKPLFEWMEGISEDLKETKLMSTAKNAVEKNWPLFESNVKQTFTNEAFQAGLPQAILDASAYLLTQMADIPVHTVDQEVQYLQELIRRFVGLLPTQRDQLNQFITLNPTATDAVADAQRVINAANTAVTTANQALAKVPTAASSLSTTSATTTTSARR